MRLFLVKSAEICIIIVIIAMSFKIGISHVTYKKIYGSNNKNLKFFPAPSKIIKINTRYFPVVNNSKSSKNKNPNVTVGYMNKPDFNNTESYTDESDEKKYTIISTSNKINGVTENRYYSVATDKPQTLETISNNILEQTSLNVPLFLPYFFEKDKLNINDIDSYLKYRNYLKQKYLKPFGLSLKDVSNTECELKGETVISSMGNTKQQKLNTSYEVHNKNENAKPESDALSKLAKFLGLFTVVQFTNEICSDGSDTVYGTCYHYVECNRLGGIAKGSCAQDHGVCCYVERSCGHRTNSNAAYFIGGTFFNTSEPGVYGCSLIIEKTDPSVKQLRLDFVDFQVAGPIDGNCQIDRFVISGQNDNNILPEICGINDGQHMYVDIDSVPGPVMLAVLSSGAKGLPMKFRIHVQQLREKSEIIAPDNCLQYFLSTNSVIKSFNYQGDVSSDVEIGYMNNLNYAICIKKLPSYCGITYSNTDANGTEMTFELNNVDDEGLPTVPEGEAGAESYNCPDDYIVLNNMRLCGHRLNDASENSNLRENNFIRVSDNGPFIIQFKTNKNITGRGFSILYQQNPCIVN